MWLSFQKLSLLLLLRLDILDEAYFKFKQEKMDEKSRRVSERESGREVQTFYCGESKSIALLEGSQASSARASVKSTTKVKTLQWLEVVA
jgi:hypothetical protein